MRRHFGGVPVIVYPAVIEKRSSLAEDEGLRCAYSGKHSGQELILIPDVGKIEPFLLRSFDHVLVVVFRIVLVVVRIHGDEADPPIQIVALDGDYAILIRMHVGAMIARDNQDHRWEIRKAGERMLLPVSAEQVTEVRRRFSDLQCVHTSKYVEDGNELLRLGHGGSSVSSTLDPRSRLGFYC